MFKSLANAVRFLSVAQVNKAKSGHLGLPLGMSDCITVLFKDFLIFDPENPAWPNRDRFVLSGGHGSAMLYSVLHLTGYQNISMKELKQFRQLGSITSGHPEYDLENGVESTTGLLGQGLANAVGIALEERILNARLGDDCINHYTYVFAGDGDLMEGVAHEASSLAGHLSLGHLIVFFDNNSITIDGDLNVSASTDISKEYEAKGWHVLSINGHSEEEISNAIKIAREDTRPSLIMCKTNIGFGTPRQGDSSAHSGHLSDSEMIELKKNLDWNCEPFEIPEYIQQAWKVIGKRSSGICKKWLETQHEKYGATEFNFTESIRKTFREIRKECFISRPFAATRASSKKVIEKLVENSNFLISGSADLGGSTGCLTKNMTPITKDDFSGNYIHYGVREHAMGSIVNGMTLGKKLKSICGTFLSFSDYMRPAIRMSALMKLPTIFVFTHDSIGVGEDGPTHQPVEHLASLRSVPNLNIFRPADAMETMECWEIAIKEKNCPSVFILTRQDVGAIRFSGKDNMCESGGYLLYEDSTSGDALITLIATGSELALAMDVKKHLNDYNISVNVASIPCWRLFDKQSIEYKEHVLGNGLRVAIEASNGFGWEKYIGRSGLFFGVNDFGKSCSCLENYNYFGLTSKNICDRLLSLKW